MQEQTQQEYLQAAKAELSKTNPDITWDEVAVLCGINPRAFKTYRMPENSKDFRAMPCLAKAALDRVVKEMAAKTS